MVLRESYFHTDMDKGTWEHREGFLREVTQLGVSLFESPPQFYKPGINIPILQMRKLNHKVKFKRWIKKRSGRNLWGMRWKLETQVKE
jgi:hypothetical protein